VSGRTTQWIYSHHKSGAHLDKYLGDCWGSVNTNGATMEFGGGFWHFGYNLTLDETNSNQRTNFWMLTMYTEVGNGSTNQLLFHFPLPVK
jgi:hypothetical protein